ncbi:DegT/DnrJ/EryC1/StrS aminotransferase family protein [Spirochaetia bacterium 38H-sp]|uniref:DegT/DnrJ/EryC1/StrS aminotransferase family protein n=1 Tax=Rarispira pelagica TaxID=3141764 RepID=A0ABU9UBT6_9SPIR
MAERGFIPFARPCLSEEEEQAVLHVMRSGWLTTGPESEAFEREFADFLGVKHALAVSSATAGLHLGLDALGAREGSFVVTTPYTFAATAEVARHVGAELIFCDIDEGSMCISVSELERVLDKYANRVAAIVPVHFAGRGADMEAIVNLAASCGASVLEDAAHAFPVRYGEKFLGAAGDAGVFSFYATKTITTGEGGMLVTDRDDVAERVSLMRLHGIDRRVWDRYTSSPGAWFYQVIEAGYKYNMPDLLAAIGRVQLKKAVLFKKKRERIARIYREALSDRDYFILPEDADEHAWHLFVVGIDENRLSIGRDEFVRLMAEKGVGCSVHFIPLFLMPYYRNRYNLSPDEFPVSYRVYLRSFSLPIYPSLSDEEIYRVISSLKEIGDRFYRKIL